MADPVMVAIPVSPEAAAALSDQERRRRVGRLVSRLVRPGADETDPLVAMLAEVKRRARAGGLTDRDVEAEIAAYNAEGRN
ncbi:MAG: hypothetical protein FJX46_02095 [Alphaproteobacteria bacterium]|nr:hypothetical protein [Alphaproteobacteria bacterium]